MTATLSPWLKFACRALLIGLAGPALTRYGDIITLEGVVALLDWCSSPPPHLAAGVDAHTVVAADPPNITVGEAYHRPLNFVTSVAIFGSRIRFLP